MADSFSSWQALKRGSSEYKALKEAKAEVLWGLVEQVRTVGLDYRSDC